MPDGPAYIHEDKYAILTCAEKFKQVKDEMESVDKNVQSLLVTTLDDIMWLCNLRGTDIENSPLFMSYALFKTSTRGDSELILYVDPSKVADIKI